MTAQPPEQLDIFAHSRDVMLRNDVLGALDRRDAPTARAALLALSNEVPGDPDLASFEVIIHTLEQPGATPLANHDALARERQHLVQAVAPATRQAMGRVAGDAWMLPLWRALATRSAGLAFMATRCEDHAVPLWLNGEAWADAAQAVESIESWRRIPAPLAWMTEARCRLGRLDDTWPLLAELAWMAPVRLEQLLRRLDDPLLLRLNKAFGATFEGTGEATDLAWFPAWAVIEKPMLAPHLALAQASQHTPQERCMRLVIELLNLERQGRHQALVERRRGLRDLHGPLYAMYMATR